MIEIRPTQWSDIEALQASLSDVNVAELAAAGWSDDEFKARLARFLATAAESNTMLIDGVPQWMLAIKQTPDVGPVTWLMLSKAYFDKGFSAIRAGRKHFKAVAARHGRITSIITASGDDVDRWMRWHGYKLVENSAKYRRYICR